MPPTPAPKRIEPYVKTCGFFRNKARSIHGAASPSSSSTLARSPRTMDELLALPGVARKTANVVLGNAFGIHEGVVVDTHVGRLAVRLGLTEHGPKDAVKIERDLMARFPRPKWTMLSHLLIAHGRAVCKARGPRCDAMHAAPIVPENRRGTRLSRPARLEATALPAASTTADRRPPTADRQKFSPDRVES